MNKKALAILTFAFFTVSLFYFSSNLTQDNYLLWKEKFGHQWTPEEDAYRRLIYLKNLQIIKKHNSDPTQTYKMGVNQFTGLTDEEFAMNYLTPISNPNIHNNDISIAPINQDIDWRAKGKVSGIKTQGSCRASWAFCGVAILQSWSLFQGNYVILSEQQLIDCSSKYGTNGCNGGSNDKGLAYVKDNGITTQYEYAYAGQAQTCLRQGGFFKIKKVNSVKGCSNISSAIQLRPIGVTIDANNWSKYSSGIFSNCENNFNHYVLLVGLTSTYYTLKNSWGTTWGQQGFIRLAPGNTCGICDDNSLWVE